MELCKPSLYKRGQVIGDKHSSMYVKSEVQPMANARQHQRGTWKVGTSEVYPQELYSQVIWLLFCIFTFIAPATNHKSACRKSFVHRTNIWRASM